MRVSVIILPAILLLGAVTCKSKAKTTKSEEASAATQPKVYKGVSNDSCAVEMAFGSYGAGIDGRSFQAVIDTLKGRNVKYSIKPLGREGECRFCMPLTELNKKQKSTLIEQLKKIALAGQLVSVSIR